MAVRWGVSVYFSACLAYFANWIPQSSNPLKKEIFDWVKISDGLPTHILELEFWRMIFFRFAGVLKDSFAQVCFMFQGRQGPAVLKPHKK